MSEFDIAVKYLLKNEGGLTNDLDDPGGLTNYGVTFNLLKQYPIDANNDGEIDISDIRVLTEQQAIEIWGKTFWEKYHYYEIVSQIIATKIFDLSANLGPMQAHIIAQRACYSCGWDLKIDGILGPKTLKAINTINNDLLLIGLRCEAAGVYRSIVIKKLQLSKFLAGWLNRAYK